MACTFISKGRKEPCKDIVGGIRAVYFIDDDLTITFDSSDTDAIDSIGSGINAFKYVVKGGSSFEQTITSSRETGTTFYDQTLTLQFKKLDKEQLKLSQRQRNQPHRLNLHNQPQRHLTHGQTPGQPKTLGLARIML